MILLFFCRTCASINDAMFCATVFELNFRWILHGIVIWLEIKVNQYDDNLRSFLSFFSTKLDSFIVFRFIRLQISYGYIADTRTQLDKRTDTEVAKRLTLEWTIAQAT